MPASRPLRPEGDRSYQRHVGMIAGLFSARLGATAGLDTKEQILVMTMNRDEAWGGGRQIAERKIFIT